jgi:hypothetical protein
MPSSNSQQVAPVKGGGSWGGVATLTALASLSAVVLFEVARRKYAAWELKKAEELIEREHARQEARKAAAARIKRFMLGTAVALAAGTAVYVRFRYGGRYGGSQVKQRAAPGALLPAVAY